MMKMRSSIQIEPKCTSAPSVSVIIADFEDAIQDCDHSLSLDRSFAKSYNRKGKAYEGKSGWSSYNEIDLLQEAVKNYKLFVKYQKNEEENKKTLDNIKLLSEKIDSLKISSNLNIKINKIKNTSNASDFKTKAD